MYVFMHACIHTHVLANEYIHHFYHLAEHQHLANNARQYLDVCAFVFVYIYIYICIYMCVCVCVCVCMCACVFWKRNISIIFVIQQSISTWQIMYVKYLHMYACTYTHEYTRTHTYALCGPPPSISAAIGPKPVIQDNTPQIHAHIRTLCPSALMFGPKLVIQDNIPQIHIHTR
jgi:hypothetical protein